MKKYQHYIDVRGEVFKPNFHVLHKPLENIRDEFCFSEDPLLVYLTVKYVLKRVSFGGKDCTKELKLECAYFLGQTCLFLPLRRHQ